MYILVIYICVYMEKSPKKRSTSFSVCACSLCVCVLPFFVYAQAKCVGCDTLSLRASERGELMRALAPKSGERMRERIACSLDRIFE